MRRFFAAALCAVLACGLTACAQGGEHSAEFYAMDTTMSVTAYGNGAKNAVQKAQTEIDRLESQLSRTRGDSVVSRLNAGSGSQTVGPEVSSLLSIAEEYSAATSGAFDITIAPLVSAWGFTTDHYQVPDQRELDELVTHVGSSHIHLGGESEVSLDNDTQIDLGGIAKGYASDCVEAILAKNGVESAKVELGGNIYVRGSKPDGNAWRVGIQDPNNSDGFVGILSLTDGFAVTSGGYQRYFEQDGKRYHHIIDPATGYPAESGLISVTVVAPGNEEETESCPGHGTMCDAFSTALFVMGEEKAVEFWRSGTYAFQMILVTEDGRVLVTDGLGDEFEQEDGGGYAYETISRSPS
ncbi:thiamine biosynthesis lipoprotein ApbE precursor [Oscillibacter valericigenes Sjm18-20]|nr:thiamine biosynthesis lipoprotein ApbE precursor [Oscillibacter valericigenes Sjm18-20]